MSRQVCTGLGRYRPLGQCKAARFADTAYTAHPRQGLGGVLLHAIIRQGHSGASAASAAWYVCPTSSRLFVVAARYVCPMSSSMLLDIGHTYTCRTYLHLPHLTYLPLPHLTYLHLQV